MVSEMQLPRKQMEELSLKTGSTYNTSHKHSCQTGAELLFFFKEEAKISFCQLLTLLVSVSYDSYSVRSSIIIIA